jgi:hypothetical protein
MTTETSISENILVKPNHRFIRANFFLTIIPFRSSFSKKVFSMPIQNKNSQPTSGLISLRKLAVWPVNEKAPVLFCTRAA